MNHQQFKLSAEDRSQFHCYQWNGSDPQAIFQVVHGGAEHAGRYAPFAEELVNSGFAVFAEDHRGHGLTAKTLGDMGPANALERTCSDVALLAQYAKKRFPGIPLVLFGHSLGSLISQLTLIRSGSLFDAIILSGSPSIDVFTQAQPAIEATVAAQGRDVAADELQLAMFSAFAEAIENPSTPFDWISGDRAEVNKYIEDPLCGFALFAGAWLDFAQSAGLTMEPEQLRKIPSDKPVFIFSGENDPVHLQGTAIEDLYNRYRKAGMTRLKKYLYPGGRHEMLNEMNRDEVTSDIISWTKSVLELH